ncbi:CiaD-like domain-containing protein [Campylobacter geochelonis]|nr:hypothetical protein [Campylobacter geochelonis]QKF71107.1 hypothetical protein CGEO_0787 [Campylobacter geochelonis]
MRLEEMTKLIIQELKAVNEGVIDDKNESLDTKKGENTSLNLDKKENLTMNSESLNSKIEPDESLNLKNISKLSKEQGTSSVEKEINLNEKPHSSVSNALLKDEEKVMMLNNNTKNGDLKTSIKDDESASLAKEKKEEIDELYAKIQALKEEQKEFLLSVQERILVLFEGLNNFDKGDIEARVELNLKFMEFLLATIDNKLKNL